eukprot:1144577-Pelagomonas_calceolata.AAC.8
MLRSKRPIRWACIYNIHGKCIGMLTIERLQILLEAYEAAKMAGMHTTIQPPVQDTAPEVMGLLSRQKMDCFAASDSLWGLRCPDWNSRRGHRYTF